MKKTTIYALQGRNPVTSQWVYRYFRTKAGAEEAIKEMNDDAKAMSKKYGHKLDRNIQKPTIRPLQLEG